MSDEREIIPQIQNKEDGDLEAEGNSARNVTTEGDGKPSIEKDGEKIENGESQNVRNQGKRTSLEGRRRAEMEEGTFVEDKDEFWNDIDIMEKPLTQKEKDALMKKLPAPIARFIVKRAQGTEKESRKGFLEAFDDINPVYDDESYSYEPNWDKRLRPNSQIDDAEVWDPDKGLNTADLQEDENGKIKPRKKTRLGLFMGKMDENKRKAEDVGLAVIGLVFLIIGGKLFFSLVSFFLRFSFSFLAIFALSAGIFFVFYLLNF